jgi:hypothetical protein
MGSGGAPRAGSSNGGGAPTGGRAPQGGASSGGPSSGGGATDAGTSGEGGGEGGSSSTGGPLPPELEWTNEYKAGIVEQIWGSGADDIYGVGRIGLLVHSTGDGTWREQDADTGSNLSGIWGTAADDIYIAVQSNFMLHWAGDDWVHQVYDAGATFTDVWGFDAENVYALGPGFVRKMGEDWKTPGERVTSGAPCFAVWGSSPSDLYAACGKSNDSVVFHSTGDGTWRSQASPGLVAAADIDGLDASHIYLAADRNVLFSRGDGTWTVELTASSPVLALWVAGPDAVFACSQTGELFRSNGHGTWSEAQQIDPSTSGSCTSIWGTGPDDMYVAGSFGIYHGLAP